MYRILALLILLAAAGCHPAADPAPKSLPRLEQRGQATQLLVNDEPYLILGGELWNSAASSAEYMAGRWEHLAAVGLNTVLAPVYWELIEPEQGRFDFSSLDTMLAEARRNRLHLVVLWFGTWKNSMSCYAPEWVKRQFGSRLPLARTETGKTLEIMTAFSEENLALDCAAFRALMEHIKEADSRQQTILMVQVENEIGMLESARDHSPAADEAFAAAVPQPIIDRLTAHTAHPDLQARWEAAGSRTAGNWEELFGPGIETDEIFMAYHYARYAEAVAAAGKAVYPLPMYVNAALNSRGRRPGAYPSAGPLAHLRDLWQAGAPSIDLLAPDIYDPLYPDWLARYDDGGNPLFIPEISRDPAPAAGARVFYAIGEHNAIGFSPYAIDDAEASAEYPLTQAYRLLRGLTPLITAKQAEGKIRGIWFDRDHREQVITLNGIDFVCRHDLTLGWSPEAKDPERWSETGALILDLGDGEYLVAGTGVVITLRPHDPASEQIIGIGRIDEISPETPILPDGTFHCLRRLNGDENHQGRHLRIPFGTYGIQRLRPYTYR